MRLLIGPWDDWQVTMLSEQRALIRAPANHRLRQVWTATCTNPAKGLCFRVDGNVCVFYAGAL